MANVPDGLVFGYVVDGMKRKDEIGSAEVGGKKRAGFGNIVDYRLPKLNGDLLELVSGKILEVGRGVDAVQQIRHISISSSGTRNVIVGAPGLGKREH